jgi:transaldolase
VNKPAYSRVINVAIAYGKQKGGTKHQQVDAAVDRLVRFLAII